MTQTAVKPIEYSPGSQPILTVTGLTRSFQMGDTTLQILKNVDLSVRPGEFLAIEGRSGSGKSTLLHLLGALDAVDGGQLNFEGKDYTRFNHQGRRGLVAWLASPSARKWAAWIFLLAVITSVVLRIVVPAMHHHATSSRPSVDASVEDQPEPGPTLLGPDLILHALWLLLILGHWIVRLVRYLMQYPQERRAATLRNRDFGFVFQFYHLLPELDVLENTLLHSMVDYGFFNFLSRRSALRKKAKDLLESLGLGHRLHHRPSQLSGGERQRVAIARALLNSPRILFADEPTGNLDAETGRQIMDVIEKLHRENNQTILMVTHDRALAREADRVLVLKNGRLDRADS